MDSTWKPGAVVANRYRLEREMGRGGTGVVFEALEVVVGRTVALKLLQADDPVWAARFVREAHLARQLEHPNTVRVYDAGTTSHGEPFIALQFLVGAPLNEALSRDGPFPPERVAHIASQILRALGEAHELGVVHRDIKPANIYLCNYAGETDFVKVLDFGIAKPFADRGRPEVAIDVDAAGAEPASLLDTLPAASNEDATMELVTSFGALIGTPAFMAPEQITLKPLTPSSDLYALGLIMCQLLTGRRFIGATTLDELCRFHIGSRELELPRKAARTWLAPVIHKATRNNPAERYASAGEMLADIAAAEARHLAQSTRRSWLIKATWAVVAAVTLLAVVFVAVVAVIQGWGLFPDLRAANPPDTNKPFVATQFIDEAESEAKAYEKDAHLMALTFEGVSPKGTMDMTWNSPDKSIALYQFGSRRRAVAGQPCGIIVRVRDAQVQVLPDEPRAHACLPRVPTPGCSLATVRRKAHERGFPDDALAHVTWSAGRWIVATPTGKHRRYVPDTCRREKKRTR